MALPTSYLSVSQINTYLTCPKKYYFNYIEKLPQTKSSALALGSSFHQTVELINQRKMYLEDDLTDEELQAVFYQTYDDVAKDVEFKEDENPEEEKEKGLRLVKTYKESEIAQETLPLALEMRFNVNVDGIPFVGYIDMIEVDGSIRDLKTSRKSPAKDSADQSLQLTAYAYAYRQLFNEQENEVSLDYAVALKRQPKVVRLETEITDSRIERFREVTYQVANALDKDIYYRNEGMPCSWCPFRSECLGINED